MTRHGNAKADDAHIEELINKVCENFMDKLESKISSSLDQLNDTIDKKFADLKSSVNILDKTINSIQTGLKSLEGKNDLLDQYNKRNNLRVHGITECENEDVLQVLLDFINSDLNVSCNLNDIDSVFRIGKTKNLKYSRIIHVQFVTNIKRNEVFAAKKKLKNKNISIFEDLTKCRYELLKLAKKKYGNKQAWSTGGNIYVWSEKENRKCLINVESDL